MATNREMTAHFNSDGTYTVGKRAKAKPKPVDVPSDAEQVAWQAGVDAGRQMERESAEAKLCGGNAVERGDLLRLAQFLKDRQSWLGASRDYCSHDEKDAWDDYEKAWTALEQFAALAAPPAATDVEAPLAGRWRHSNGIVCCGTLRIFSADFDTVPSDEFQSSLLDWICTALNCAQKSVMGDAKDAQRWREFDRAASSPGFDLQCDAGGWAFLKVQIDAAIAQQGKEGA